MSSTFTTLDATTALVSAIEQFWRDGQFSDIKLFGGNGPEPNLDKLAKFANYEIVFGESDQVTLGQDPVDRTFGSVEFQFGTRAGTGKRALLGMQAYMKGCLKAGTFDRVKTLIPSPIGASAGNGWAFEGLYVPFYFDSSPAANTHI